MATAQVAASSEELTAGVQQVAANANAVAGMADKSADAATQGNTAVDAAMIKWKILKGLLPIPLS